MPGLSDTLEQIHTTLGTLGEVLTQEQEQLCAGRIDAVRLQSCTQRKETLLATLRHLDTRRRGDSEIPPPYEDHPALSARWQAIRELTQRLQHMNQHNGRLLEQHLQRNQEMLGTLRGRHGPSLYGPDGQAHPGPMPGKKLGV
ncbi:flagella synthesis protein FlgN [Enterobacillus tribolii]|uniref:Flagella synthesis protein FlgN n=1 Tax=Enterobacillus tribolii TaxID=1487935 RepID=A0A370R2V6_9GAMM|nr:flagellar export chaperone FlgN [Enterobacillus tribolii]RDK96767.1 flagella synthesis protein FlgN [Enterobacillus tribolii]